MGRPVASAPAPTNAKGEEVARLPRIPEDPASPLLTTAGAPLLDAGKIDVNSYEELKRHFAREPLAKAHPNPSRPGIRGDEIVPKGLRMWDDVKAGREGQNGAGWIAAYSSRREPKKEKWFNIQTCGSWRLAFLLAQLQRQIWQQGCHSATVKPDLALQAVSARRITKKRPVEESEVLAQAPAGREAAKADTAKEIDAESTVPETQAPKPLTESSARMQQLLERVRAKEIGSATSPVKEHKDGPSSDLVSKVSLLLAAAGADSPPPKQRRSALREFGSGEKLPKQPRF